MKMKSKLRHRMKRQVSVILTIVMLLTIIPMNGFAVELNGEGGIYTGEEATPSGLPERQKNGSTQGNATDSDADMDLIDDLELATSGDAESLSGEAIMFIDRVEKLDKEQLLQLIADYAEARNAYGSVAAKEDVDAAELERAAAACEAAEDALQKAYDGAALYRLYEQIPGEEKAHRGVARAYEKLEDIHDTYQKAMQELQGAFTYANQTYDKVISVIGTGYTIKTVEKGTSLEEAVKMFPEQMQVRLGDGKGNSDPNTVTLDVTWELKEGYTYDGDTEGKYPFGMELPNGYSWAIGSSWFTLYIQVVSSEKKEICFWLDSEVDNFENLTFQLREEQNPAVFATFIERGTADKGGEVLQYLKYELYQDVGYSYICRPYEYVWTGGSVSGGTQDVVISLTKLPYCTVQFAVVNEAGSPVPGTVIAVANGGQTTQMISPGDTDGTMFCVPVQSQSPAISDSNHITYTIEAPGYMPCYSGSSFTIDDRGKEILLPIILTKLSEKKTVEEVYDKKWDYTADELEIGTPEELAAYSYWSNKKKDVFKNKKIVLTDDIDISGIQWTPISCYPGASAVGSFDGQGYTVSLDMVELYQDNYYFGGLFGFVTGSSIENLNVEGNIRISGNVAYAFVGGIAAALVQDNAVIRNCSSNVDITFLNTPAASYIGGITGQVGSAELEHCSYDGDIHIDRGNATYVGGIAGLVAAGGSVQHAVTSGSIVLDSGYVLLGGITGAMSANTSRITGCSSDMDILLPDSGYTGYIGGLVGNNSSGRVSNAYFHGSCRTTDKLLSAISGNNKGSFESCGYAEGSGHNDSNISGVTCITADMPPEEVLNALNTAGELPWFIYVAGEPVLIALPEEAVVTRELDGVQYVQEGDEVSFTVAATSPDGGNLVYQWQKDGENLAEGNASSYKIPVVTPASEGTYSVIVKNQNVREETSAGADGGSCQLIVVKKGEIQVASGGYQGDWTKDSVVFELSGGLSDYLFGYEYLSTGAGEMPGAADTRWSLCVGALKNIVTASEEGELYYWFRTRDQAGQAGDAEGPVRVRIDRTVPVLEQPIITENIPGTEQVTIRLSASDAMSGLKEIHYLITEAGDAEPSSQQIQAGTSCQPGKVRITGLTAGSAYRVYAAASDLAGNASAIRSVEFKKEKTAGEPSRWESTSEDGSSGTGSWVGANGITSYIKPDGTYCRAEWYMIQEQWYYFDESGRMVTGWYYDPAYQAWFYLKPDGTMAVGWIELNGKWYYLNPLSDGKRGVMYADAWINGYYLGKDGAWVEEKSQ